jgi:peptide/nickel transport system permease protein
VRILAIFCAVTPSFFLALLLQILAGYVLHILPTTGRMPHNIDFVADITGLMTVDGLLKGRLDVLRRGFPLPAAALARARRLRRWARSPASPARR